MISSQLISRILWLVGLAAFAYVGTMGYVANQNAKNSICTGKPVVMKKTVDASKK
jgi:hypothetical protein